MADLKELARAKNRAILNDIGELAVNTLKNRMSRMRKSPTDWRLPYLKTGKPSLLYDTIGFNSLLDKSAVEITAQSYLRTLNDGQPKGTIVTISQMLKFIDNRGIKPKKIAGKGAKQITIQQLAGIFVRSIKRKGTEPREFIEATYIDLNAIIPRLLNLRIGNLINAIGK